jgi:hypothetical protein
MEIDKAKLWYQTNLDMFLNRWYANYDDARKALENHGGFLLPYQSHFFVCQQDVISALGLDPNDPDWEKIGHDCAQPKDLEAFARLSSVRENLVRNASSDNE